MLWFRVLLSQTALLSLLRCYPSATEHKDLFISCDKDADRRVSIAELEACMGSIRGSTSGDDDRISDLNNILSTGPSLLQRDKHAALNIMKMFDTDRDDVITLREYQHVLGRSKARSGSGSDDDYVDVLRADGSTQRMLLADMFEMAQEPLKDFKMRDNQLYREESKVNVSLDAVRRDNPSLANMISIGEWSFNQLRRAADSLVDGSLVGLVSLPTGGSTVDERTYLKDRKDSLKEEAELIRSDNLFKGDFEVTLQ
jgi:cation transport regulator ChaB